MFSFKSSLKEIYKYAAYHFPQRLFGVGYYAIFNILKMFIMLACDIFNYYLSELINRFKRSICFSFLAKSVLADVAHINFECSSSTFYPRVNGFFLEERIKETKEHPGAVSRNSVYFLLRKTDEQGHPASLPLGLLTLKCFIPL